MRRLFTILSALSLAFCAATYVLCSRSYHAGDIIEQARLVQRRAPEADFPSDHYRLMTFYSGHGGFVLMHTENYPRQIVTCGPHGAGQHSPAPTCDCRVTGSA